MPKKFHDGHYDARAAQERARVYPIILAACLKRGMRVREDFSPAELAQLQAKVSGWIASGRCRVTYAGDAPLETLS